MKEVSWPWLVALGAVTAVNIATFAPPWPRPPRLGFFQALELTQASTAITIVVPGALRRGWRCRGRCCAAGRARTAEITRGITLVGLWNQLINLAYPIVAVFLLTVEGEETALLATAAFVGVAVLGVVLTGFVLALSSDRLAHDVGEVAARLVSWVRAKIRRGPVAWGGPRLQRFRRSAGDLLKRRWHVLTLASLAGSLSVFLVLLVSLRALGRHGRRGEHRRGVRRVGAHPPTGLDPDHAGRDRRHRAGLTSALIAFGGGNAEVVAAVLVYRFLTIAPTIVYGLVAAASWRRHVPRGEQAEARHAVEETPLAGDRSTFESDGACADAARAGPVAR